MVKISADSSSTETTKYIRYKVKMVPRLLKFHYKILADLLNVRKCFKEFIFLLFVFDIKNVYFYGIINSKVKNIRFVFRLVFPKIVSSS